MCTNAQKADHCAKEKKEEIKKKKINNPMTDLPVLIKIEMITD